MPIMELSLVVFGSRTLEQRPLQIPVPLHGERWKNDKPAASHRKQVKETMAQFSVRRPKTYDVCLDAVGRTIDNYYRRPHVEATLIAQTNWLPKLSSLVDEFIWTIDSSGGVPGQYTWFHPGSRHMTVRGLA